MPVRIAAVSGRASYTRSFHCKCDNGGKPVISILCPTRGRPEQCQRMIESVRATAYQNVEIMLYFDHDDPDRQRAFPGADRVLSGEFPNVGLAWNWLAERAAGNIIFMGNDDFVFMTPEWDEEIENTFERVFPDGIGVLWCNDGSPRASLRCAVPIVTRRWIEVAGYTPGIFEFFFNDTWIADLGTRIGRTHYLGDVLIEHRHVAFGKARMDSTYQLHRVTNPERNKRDAEKFAKSMDERKALADKLREAMNETWKSDS